MAIAILVIAICLEGYSFRTAVEESRPLKGSGSWWRFIRTSRNPELPVVLLEDTGALVGLRPRAGRCRATMLTGNPVWDGVGTIGIGVLLGVIAVILMIEMHSLLIGEGATRDEGKAIRAALEADRQHRPADPPAYAVHGSRGTAGRREDRAPACDRSRHRGQQQSTPQRPRSVPRCPPPRSSTWNQISIGRRGPSGPLARR